MGWTSVFDLVGNFATGHSQFDFLNAHSIVEHPISPCSVDGHNSVLAGLNHRSRTDQMRRVHRHRVSSGILNHPTREIDGDLSDVGDFDPFSTGPGCIIVGPIGVCLLYTSPSPRDYAASRMPSSA